MAQSIDLNQKGTLAFSERRSKKSLAHFLTLSLVICSPNLSLAQTTQEPTEGTPSAPSAVEECIQSRRKDSMYKALSQCRTSAIPTEAEALAFTVKHLEGKDSRVMGQPCRMGSETLISNDTLSPKLCQDPGGEVCKLTRNSGSLLDSNCHFVTQKQEDLVQTPEGLEADCRGEVARNEFLKDKARTECTKPDNVSNSNEDCLNGLRVKYRKDLIAAERKEIYKKETTDKVQKTFDRIKKQFLSMIDSPQSPVAPYYKSYVKRLIKNTDLKWPKGNEKGFALECFNKHPSGPNQPESDTFNAFNDTQGKMTLCSGTMKSLEALNPYALIETLAHELAHSIDPCALEKDAFNQLKNDEKTKGKGLGAPDVANREIYPGLVKCLRGGGGSQGCENAVLHCSERKAMIAACQTWDKKGIKYCTDTYAPAIPSCKSKSLDYTAKHNGQAGAHQCQIGEGTSDYFSAEVTGRIIAQDRESGALNLEGQRNALVGITGDLLGDTGCGFGPNSPNWLVNNEHPPGKTRINRLFMGNSTFRKALGCSVGPGKEQGGLEKSCDKK